VRNISLLDIELAFSAIFRSFNFNTLILMFHFWYFATGAKCSFRAKTAKVV